MTAIALGSARQGRLRPSFFFCGLAALCWLCSLWASVASAQQRMYRCGQEYTNVPVDADRCERLLPQTVTTVSGTRALPQPQSQPGASAAGAAPVASVDSAAQSQRDDMARAIVAAELERARQRHADLLAQYRQGVPLRAAGESPNAPAEQERLGRLQAALERSQRDLDSLQRELARRPPPSARP